MPRSRQPYWLPDIFYPWQVEQLTGIPSITLWRWRRTGFYEPAEKRHDPRYRFKDVCILLCVVKMRVLGVSHQKMRTKYLAQIQAYIEQALADGHQLQELCFTLMTGKTVCVYSKRGLYSLWQPKWVIDFGEIEQSVKTLKPLLEKQGEPLTS